MGLVSVKSKGNWKKTRKFLNKISSISYRKLLEDCAVKGVIALTQATPIDSGETADAWGYDIKVTEEMTSITWTNSNLTSYGEPIVILLMYGHATRNGKFVQGFDFVTPALEPIFDEIADKIWKEVNG